MAGKTFYRPFRDGEEHRFTKDLINNQIPSFYIEDGPKLISLLQEYYSFLHERFVPTHVPRRSEAPRFDRPRTHPADVRRQEHDVRR